MKYALRISSVDRAYSAVAITSLPECPEIVLGIINVHGNVLPVINLRSRFQLPQKTLTPSAYLIAAHTRQRAVVLVVDNVEDVIEYDEQEIISAQSVVPNIGYVEGVIKLKDEMILIHDLDSLLSLEDEAQLDRALG